MNDLAPITPKQIQAKAYVKPSKLQKLIDVINRKLLSIGLPDNKIQYDILFGKAKTCKDGTPITLHYIQSELNLIDLSTNDLNFIVKTYREAGWKVVRHSNAIWFKGVETETQS